jgi:cytoskeletal protein CcmA (bactofilin family)
MVVGQGTRLSGEIEGCELLLVEGQLRGVLDSVKRLEISASGRFAGRAVVETCRIDGGFEGELTVDGLLSLEARGRIKGTLRYREIEVARGAVVSGGVDLFSATPFEPAPRPLFDPATGRRGGPRSRPLSFIGPSKEESD